MLRNYIGAQIEAPHSENFMDSIFNFLRSDLFLSLLGGFALGAAGLAIIKPASASDVTVEADGPRPSHFRETHRSTGPSNYRHGKQEI